MTVVGTAVFGVFGVALTFHYLLDGLLASLLSMLGSLAMITHLFLI